MAEQVQEQVADYVAAFLDSAWGEERDAAVHFLRRVEQYHADYRVRGLVHAVRWGLRSGRLPLGLDWWLLQEGDVAGVAAWLDQVVEREESDGSQQGDLDAAVAAWRLLVA